MQASLITVWRKSLCDWSLCGLIRALASSGVK